MVNAGIMDLEEFESIVCKNKISIVDFSATWCGPCRMIAPIIEDSSEKHKGEYFYYQVDVDSSEELAEKFDIKVVPTIIVLKNGKELGRTSGFMELEDLEKFLKSTIKNTGK